MQQNSKCRLSDDKNEIIMEYKSSMMKWER